MSNAVLLGSLEGIAHFALDVSKVIICYKSQNTRYTLSLLINFFQEEDVSIPQPAGSTYTDLMFALNCESISRRTLSHLISFIEIFQLKTVRSFLRLVV